MPAPQQPVAPAGSPASPRVSAILREFAAGFRQFWDGYWTSPHGC